MVLKFNQRKKVMTTEEEKKKKSPIEELWRGKKGTPFF
jgi:hypothetical protein